MKFVSLFSGIGGFDLAFGHAGMECVSVCEIDKNAQNILRRHFPEATLYDDVRKVGKETHERKSIDLVCGGFPCQDLSVAGKRAGLAGERSGLWFEFARVIDELEPRWIVIENVPGLLSSHKGKDFAIIIRWLAERGYGVTWRVLDAQYFGVAQRRRRVFIVGSLGNGRAAEVLFESEGMSGDTPPSRKAGKDVAFSLRADPSHSGDKGDGGINTTIINVANSGANQNNVKETDTLDTWASFAVAFSSKDYGNDAAENISPTLRSMNFKDSHVNGGGQIAVAFQQNTRDEVRLMGGGGQRAGALAAQAGMKQQNYIMAHGQGGAELVNDGSPSLTRNHEAPILNGVRRLTPVECERLQGFPDGWTDGQADTVRYRQLGNAVAVPVVEWIGKRIMQAELLK